MQSLPPLDILLVRHAEPVAIGTPDIADDDRPLTEAGRSAAEELAVELAREAVEVALPHTEPVHQDDHAGTVTADTGDRLTAWLC